MSDNQQSAAHCGMSEHAQFESYHNWLVAQLRLQVSSLTSERDAFRAQVAALMAERDAFKLAAEEANNAMLAMLRWKRCANAVF